MTLQEILDELTNSLPIKATEVGWEKVGEDVQQAQSRIYNELLAITKASREKALPIAYIEKQLEELFG